MHDPRERWFVALAMLLTLVTGAVDAVSFIGLGGVFSANMTGNVVVLAVGGSGTRAAPMMTVTGALLGFLGGAALTARFLRAGGSVTARCRGRSVVVLASLTCATSMACLHLVWESLPSGRPATVATALLGLMMGAQAATVRRLMINDVSSVVVTMNLVGLAADSRGVTGAGGTGRRLGAVTSLAAGAVIGAFLLRMGGPSTATGFAAALLAVATALALRLREQPDAAEGVPDRPEPIPLAHGATVESELAGHGAVAAAGVGQGVQGLEQP